MKTLIAVICLSFIFTIDSKIGGTVSQENGNGGNIAWTNPTNAEVEDGVNAVASTVNTDDITYRLLAVNFGFSIPGDATIVSVQPFIKCYDILGDGSDPEGINLWLFRGTWEGAYGTSAEAVGFAPVEWLDVSYPGLTWTIAELNNNSYGFAVSATNPNGFNPNDFEIDAFKMVVTYSEPGGATKRVIGYVGGRNVTEELVGTTWETVSITKGK